MCITPNVKTVSDSLMHPITYVPSSVCYLLAVGAQFAFRNWAGDGLENCDLFDYRSVDPLFS